MPLSESLNITSFQKKLVLTMPFNALTVDDFSAFFKPVNIVYDTISKPSTQDNEFGLSDSNLPFISATDNTELNFSDNTEWDQFLDLPPIFPEVFPLPELSIPSLASVPHNGNHLAPGNATAPLPPSPVPSLTSTSSSEAIYSHQGPLLPYESLPKTPKALKRLLTKRGVPVKSRSSYSISAIWDFMWDNVRLSENRRAQTGPGKHGVRILKHFNNIEGARAHLASAQAQRQSLSQRKLPAIEARRQRDKRRDFFCFMPGCGLCFERADKLERHLLETSVHGTIKPYLCTYAKCRKSYVAEATFFAHAQQHESAGHGAFRQPYPWHCPYPSVVDSLFRNMAALSNPCVDDGIELS